MNTALLDRNEAFDPSLSIHRALAAVREHLGMDVAYLSEIEDGKSIFRSVDAPGLEEIIKPGDTRDLDTVYCNHILEGRLPELIPDTAREPVAVGMAITKAVPIGAHMSIPVRLRDGSVYGMFCCLSARPNASLNERDLSTMRMFAELAAEKVSDRQEREAAEKKRRDAVEALLAPDAFALVFQLICRLADREPQGFEALSRFPGEPYRAPDKWFADAEAAGLQAELETAAVARALDNVAHLPAGTYVSLNASPDTILDGAFQAMLLKRPNTALDALVLEITEHAPVTDYAALAEALAPLRELGLRLAIDDAGAGYASLSHIIRLQPDLIKLDMSLVRDVDSDPARHALADAMVTFAREIGSAVVAEGIETEAELAALERLGIGLGQGYLLGRPAPAKRADASTRAEVAA